jgi:hypothetical protein
MIHIVLRQEIKRFFTGLDTISRGNARRMFFLIKMFIPDVKRYYSTWNRQIGRYDVFIERDCRESKKQRVRVGTSKLCSAFPNRDIMYYRISIDRFDFPFQMLHQKSFDHIVNAYHFNKIPPDKRDGYTYRMYLLSSDIDFYAQLHSDMDEGICGLILSGTTSKGIPVSLTYNYMNMRSLYFADNKWMLAGRQLTANSHLIKYMGISRTMFPAFINLLHKGTQYAVIRTSNHSIGYWNQLTLQWDVSDPNTPQEPAPSDEVSVWGRPARVTVGQPQKKKMSFAQAQRLKQYNRYKQMCEGG